MCVGGDVCTYRMSSSTPSCKRPRATRSGSRRLARVRCTCGRLLLALAPDWVSTPRRGIISLCTPGKGSQDESVAYCCCVVTSRVGSHSGSPVGPYFQVHLNVSLALSFGCCCDSLTSLHHLCATGLPGCVLCGRIVSPAGVKSGMSGINLVVSTRFHRAAPKGVGNTKSITNYAPAFMAQRDAKAAGYHEALFLDTTDTNVEEVGGVCA